MVRFPSFREARIAAVCSKLINAAAAVTIEDGRAPRRIMKNRRNYYRILQVQPDAPPEIIRASYRTMMRELKRHPDLGGLAWEASVINEAYETLSDPDRRSAYDDELFLKFTKQPYSRLRKPIVPIICPVCKRPLSRKPEPGEICPTCHTPLKSDFSPKAESENKRSLDRIKSSAAMDYYSQWPGKPEKGRMIDFSPIGMRFFCEKKIPPGTVLKISSGLFEASGTVTNLSEEMEKGRTFYSVGVCFLAVRFAESRGTFFSTTA